MCGCVCVCVCVCVCDLYKCIFVAINELCKALRAPERQGAVQILLLLSVDLFCNYPISVSALKRELDDVLW